MDKQDNERRGYDYIIVGTGPGGGTIARELTRAGARVCMVERGPRHEKLLGAPFGPRILEGGGFFCRSLEGVYIARGIALGGSSMVYNANVFNPPEKIFAQIGLDFSQEVQELREEIGVRQLPERFFKHWSGGNRVLQAAQDMGLYFRPQDKFIDPDKCLVGCDSCMIGCKRGAKWTTRNFVDQAVAGGATLLTSTPVERVIIEKGKAKGIATKHGKLLYGDKVVLAAGGIGTARILLRSGLKDVGKSFYMDPMDIVVGYAKEPGKGSWREMSFTHAIESHKETDRFIIGNISAFAVAATSAMRLNMLRHNLPRAAHIKRAMGLFVKLGDEQQGQVYEDGRISKPFTETDRKRMAKGVDISKEILVRAGADPKTLAVGRGIGGHPGGTAAMGKAVDGNFQCAHENLFVCDGSVLPESPGVPPSLTIMSMAKMFGKIQAGILNAEDRKTQPKAA